MDPPPVPGSSFSELPSSQTSIPSRSQSFSQKSDDSQTAAEFIDSQLQLEADAREALPYKFENCTKTIGKLRQVLFSCLTCNPPPSNPSDPYTPAGVCYSCSIQCHGEHTLVELFNKRNFVCDCGTTRLPATSPCAIRLNPETNTKGGVHSEEPAPDNKYNHNFRNSFCGCECDYDPHQQKGTMFQCLGLGTAETGGCGEDWWHPGCVVGLGPDWFETASQKNDVKKTQHTGLLTSITEVAENVVDEANAEAAPEVMEEDEDDNPPLPPGFPHEDDFEGFICYKCVDANPWIKRYGGGPGFLAPVFKRSAAPSPERGLLAMTQEVIASHLAPPKKRKAEDDEESVASDRSKRVKSDLPTEASAPEPANATTALPTKTLLVTKAAENAACKLETLPPTPEGQMSLFFKADFRDHLCKCPDCFPLLKPHDQLIEEEINYEPTLSGSEEEAGGSTVGSGSIYERGESALKNVDRVRAIEGVMAFQQLKDKLKPLFQQFAGTGKAISAEDIKAHFAKMRGDDEAIKAAGEDAKTSKKDEDQRREQGGY
ncbi:metaphase-anaphase transition protein-like protein mlo2 [Mollisia scopiformis]|uniref:Metaphase-anaphase transition protein-like protein mlo2 n=1 Tax=Mollisia scopiformis TaxID=149040 RepID=A0A194XE93_MOLSC|nr:metaphase-anaphase transition protein-like protein mlo2 [Mollisia scopiformis]KUJ18082.1 metaphase-anaphase transition protein-like protein mlo2 [Mollisia scopiformis]